jgi:hypothetical protein
LFHNGAKKPHENLEDVLLECGIPSSIIHELLASVLYDDGVLRTLKEHQIRLDKYSTSVVHKVYTELEHYDDIHLVEEVLRYKKGHSSNVNDSLEQGRALVSQYLLSATLKDLSLLITMTRVSQKSSGMKRIKTKHGEFEYKIKAIDVDIKCHQNIERYLKVERKLMENSKALEGIDCRID